MNNKCGDGDGCICSSIKMVIFKNLKIELDREIMITTIMTLLTKCRLTMTITLFGYLFYVCGLDDYYL